MPADFGDESGEKLFDWMLRLGERMSEDAMRDAAKGLMDAFRHARGEFGGEGVEEAYSVVRLKMDEFASLPEYQTIKEIIDERLTREGVNHEFATLEGSEYLLFHTDDAPTVSTVFKDLETQVEAGLEKAKAEIEKSREETEHTDDKAYEDTAHDRFDKTDSKDAKHSQSTQKSPSRTRDNEPLEKRSKRACATSKAIAKTKDRVHEITPIEVKSK